MRRTLSMRITLRKLDSTHSCERISLIIKTKLSVQRIKSPRVIKNGSAKFFGQSFSMPLNVKEFQFQVQDAENGNCLINLPVSKEVVCQFTPRTNVFCSEQGPFKLTWQAQLVSDNEQNNLELTDRDFKDLEETPNDNEFGFDSIQPADKIKKRRNSTKKSKLLDTISEPGEVSDRIYTSGFHTAIKKRSIQEITTQINEGTNQYKPLMSPIIQNQAFSRKSTSKSKSKQKPTKQNSKISRELKKRKSTIEQVLSDKEHCERRRSPNVKPVQIIRKLHRHRSGLIERLGVKEMVCTGIFGIISGITAAQI